MLSPKLLGATALASIFAVAQAQAAVTPEDVWQKWQDIAAASGQKITAAQAARDGDTLAVEGVSITTPPGELQATVLMDELRFVDNGDGTVLVEIPASIPVEVVTTGDKPATIKLSLTQEDFQLIASGSPEAMSYTNSVSKMALTLDSAEGADMSNVAFQAAVTDASGSGDYSGTSNTSTYQVGGLDVTFSAEGSDAAGPSSGNINLHLSDLKGDSTGNMFAFGEIENLSAALKAGLAASGTFSYGAGDFSLNGTDASGQTSVTASLTGGSVEFGMDSTALHYQTTTKGLAVKATTPDLPFPELNLGFSELSFGLGMPTTPKAEPGPFGVLVKLVDLTISDEVWAMFDPTGQLPHDPATLVLDATGLATLKADIFDPKTPPSAATADLNALTVSDLQVKVAGADVSGKGDFTFDNSDLTTFDGIPAPTGKLDLHATGINGLLDKLVAMGLLPEDQIGSARMMLAMFAKAGPAQDELTSTLEFKDKGFFANGQQLK